MPKRAAATAASLQTTTTAIHMPRHRSGVTTSLRVERKLSVFQNDDRRMSPVTRYPIRFGALAAQCSPALFLVASVALGIVHGASFAAEHGAALHFTAWFLFGFILVCEARFVDAASRIFAFFVSSFATGLWWMAQALVATTSLGPALGPLAFAVCCAILAAIPAFALIAMLNATARRDALWIVALAAAVMLAEYARALLLTGFPWLQSGHVYAGSPFGLLLPFVGAQAVGSLAVAAGLLLSEGVRRTYELSRRVGVVAGSLIVAIPLSVSSFETATSADTTPSGATQKAVEFTLLQPALHPGEKFTRAKLTEHARTLVQLAQLALPRGGIVVALETALPTTWQGLPAHAREEIDGAVAASGVRWVVGAFETGVAGYPMNAVIELRPGGSKPTPRYHKVHLVPFAEYAPAGLRWFADLLHLPMSRRARGATQQAMPNVDLIHTICLDLLYPLGSDRASGSVIVNHSNFAWAQADAPRLQFLAAARTRAREYGKPVLIAANDGPTAAIGNDGTVLQQLPFRERGTLAVSVMPTTKPTLYGRTGDTPFLLTAVALVILAVAPLRRSLGARSVTREC